MQICLGLWWKEWHRAICLLRLQLWRWQIRCRSQTSIYAGILLFHWWAPLVIITYSQLPAQSFICSPVKIWHEFHGLSKTISSPFHFSLWLFIITSLGQCFWHFIPPWGYLSLLAWGNILAISFLPRAICHCLPRAMFLVFQSPLGQFVIACIGRYFCHFIPP